MKLIIGNKNYSSWSLRAWLLLAAGNVPFEEVKILLSQDETRTEIERYTNAGRVPVLHDKDLVVWDSLAICEYVSEQYLSGKGWPADSQARAKARSCCAEMHSGFFALRNQMPMNCRAVNRRVPMTAELEKDIRRIDQIWTQMRNEYADLGPWLFGDFSIADCMFAPVVFRFFTYDANVSETSQQYMSTLLGHPDVQDWLGEARTEPEVIDDDEAGHNGAS